MNIWGGGERGEHAKLTPLGGSGGMLPKKNFEFACSEIESGGICQISGVKKSASIGAT